jgi:hypothetical protein
LRKVALPRVSETRVPHSASVRNISSSDSCSLHYKGTAGRPLLLPARSTRHIPRNSVVLARTIAD